MPLLWFVYPLNGSGRRNPDAADRGQDSFLFFYVEKGGQPDATCEPTYRSTRPTQFGLLGIGALLAQSGQPSYARVCPLLE